jgi:hypothetical protein
MSIAESDCLANVSLSYLRTLGAIPYEIESIPVCYAAQRRDNAFPILPSPPVLNGR